MLIRTNVTNIGDPFIVNDGNFYYMYSTTFDVCGFKVRRSSDLKEWEDLGVCLDLSDSWACRDFWAPEVRYHQGRYVMHFSARRTVDESLRIGVAVSDHPWGPFIQPRNEPMFDFGYAAIDGHVFIDDDGQAYFYFSKDCSEHVVDGVHTSTICVAKMNSDLTALTTHEKELFSAEYPYEGGDNPSWRWNEGPFVLKKDQQYYMTYSANFYSSSRYCICLATSSDPMGPFVKYAHNPILTNKDCDSDFSGPGHNAFFRDREGNLKMTCHIHTDENHPSEDRKAAILDAQVKDGTIHFVF